MALKTSKAVDHVVYLIKVLKLLQNVIAKPLEILFNTSFSTGIVPENFKLARVLPVFKKGDHTNLNNYRPISLLSVFNKLLEKLMYNRLIAYLQKKNILYDKQFGFCSQNSTEHAILTIIDKIQKAIENRNHSCGIFLDFSKAFDTVHHGILINKLEKYGIRGIANDWFASYLTGRKHFVSMNNISSNLNDINCGIPQGYVLGPLLFLLYINDFYKCSELFDFHHFADDSNLFYENEDLLDLESNINQELVNINVWLCANKLSLNIEKSNFVIFHPHQKKIEIDVSLSINGRYLKKVDYIKYLGVFIDSHLSWKYQVDHIARKIKRGIGILSKLRHFLNIKILVNLYYAIIYPFLIYALIIWGNTYSTTLKPLIILQKKAMRVITFSRFDEHSSPLFKRLQILKFTHLITLRMTMFMYKYHRQLLPSSLNDLFTPVYQIHSYNIRLSSNLCFSLPKIRTNFGLFNIRYQGVKAWNVLSEADKQMTFLQLKRKIKAAFINQY